MTLVACTGVAILIVVVSARLFGQEETGVPVASGVLLLTGTIMKESYPVEPKLISLRVILGTFILCTFVLMDVYSGALVSFFTIRLPPTLFTKITGIDFTFEIEN